LFNYQREAKGITIVPTSDAIRRCVEHLKENKVIALVADRDFSTSGIRMDFLGKKVNLPKGPAMFSWKTGAPIVPMFLIRNKNKAFTLSCSEAIYPPEQDTQLNEDQIVEEIMRQYIKEIEKKIKAYPSQWLLFREFGVK